MRVWKTQDQHKNPLRSVSQLLAGLLVDNLQLEPVIDIVFTQSYLIIRVNKNIRNIKPVEL